MRFNDREISSVGGLLAALKRQRAEKTVWFRGHSNSSWKLVPSLARNKNHLAAESALLKRFMQNAVPHLSRLPDQEWEWMFTMQHHRAPTRLLDWTESPLIALYFSVTDPQQRKKDGAVWCLNPISLNQAARFSFKFEAEIPSFGIDGVLDSYLPSRVEEAPNLLNPVAIMGPRNTPRMAAQLGVFTINHRDHVPIESIAPGKHVWRFIVPAKAKTDIAEELAVLGVTALSVFPELDRVADLAKELLK